MGSRADLYRKNAENSKYKFGNQNKNKKNRKKSKNNYKTNKNKSRGKVKDKLDEKIEYLNSLHNLDKLTIREITKYDGDWSYFIADSFKDRLKIHQLRGIHQSLKKIEQTIENTDNILWNHVQLHYNLFKLDLNLKYERNTIPEKFYKLIVSLTNIVDNVAEDRRIDNLKKLIVLVDAMVGYHKYLTNTSNNDYNNTFKEITLKINSDYLLNIQNNDVHIKDTEKIANTISRNDADKTVTIYQLRKIFNVYKSWENRLNDDWSNIEEEYYKFYPKLAYMTGRKLITGEFFELIRYCMDVVDNGDNAEKVIKFKGFIEFYESIISYYTYQNVKYELNRKDKGE